jgi:tRNA(Arg) A34 adenosine deaminase TadA
VEISHTVTLDLPSWVSSFVTGFAVPDTDERAVGLAIALARENVERKTGGPFGAVITDGDGRIISAGVNLVVPRHNSVLHAEVVALMLAHEATGNHSLARAGRQPMTLAASCDPCAMCLGAALWSGVARLATGALREDAEQLSFDEGPVYPDSWTYLEGRGIEIHRGIMRAKGKAVLRLYKEMGGEIYNA